MSKKTETLLAERDALRAEVLDIATRAEAGTATDEDAERSTAALADLDRVEAEYNKSVAHDQQIDAIRAASQVEGSTERAYDGINVNVRKDPFEVLGRISRADVGSDDIRSRALSAFEDKANTRGMDSKAHETLMERLDTVPGAADYALAHGTPQFRTAFAKIVKAGGNVGMVDFTTEERQALTAAENMRTALNITTGASGQFSLPTVFDPTLIHTGTAAVNPVRSLARVVQGTQNVWNGVSVGNVTTYWHAEAAALTEGSPTLAHPIVTAGHLTGYLTGSWEFFDDSSMVTQLPGLIGEAFDYAESTAFISGSGTSQPLGLVTAISATIGSTVTATTRGGFTSASSADVFALFSAIPSRYEDTSTAIANKKSWNTVRQMSPNGVGSMFWGQLSEGIAPNPAHPLLGYPTRNSSDMPTTTTTGTVLIVVGDFKQYLILDVVGTTVEFMQNVVNSSGIPTGQRGVIARKRVGANTTDINAFRFLLA